MKNFSLNPFSIYHYSENLSDLLKEALHGQSESTASEEWSVDDQKANDPRITFFEQRVAALEGGTEAIALKSFYLAKMSVFRNLLTAGDNIVSFNSHTLAVKDSPRLKRYGIDVKHSEDGSLTSFKSLLDDRTRLIYLETISNRYLNIPDFQKIVTIARERQIPIVVDNSAGAAGYLTQPLKHGAHIVIESTRSWLPSHRSVIGAVIVDGGNYNWQNGKFPHFRTDRFNQYHLQEKRLLSKEELKSGFSLISFIKKKGNINYNKYQIPHDPLTLIHDLENVPRIAGIQSANALNLAHYLLRKEEVSEVDYTGLPKNRSYFTALTYFRNGFGNTILFSLKPIYSETMIRRFSEYIKQGLEIEIDVVTTTSLPTIKVHVPAISYSLVEEAFDRAFAHLRSVNTDAPGNISLPELLQRITI